MTSYYKRTGTEIPGYRELEDYERIKELDIIRPTSCTRMLNRTNNYVHFFSRAYDSLRLYVVDVDKNLTSLRACEIVDYLIPKAVEALGPDGIIMKRKYSIWRKKLNLPKPMQKPSLPLP